MMKRPQSTHFRAQSLMSFHKLISNFKEDFTQQRHEIVKLEKKANQQFGVQFSKANPWIVPDIEVETFKLKDGNIFN